MSIPRIHQAKYLPEEELFRKYYQEMGRAASLPKLQRWLAGEGKVNPDTGKPFSVPAIHQAMWRWALRNLEEAKKIYTEYCLLYGIYVKDDEWKQMINTRAYNCLKKSGYKRFLRENPEYGS